MRPRARRNFSKSPKSLARGNKEHIAAVIPARYGSTRLPGKPLVDLCGKPMIQHVFERVKQVSRIDRVIVATDDVRVVDAVKRFGGEVVMTPADIRSGSDRVAFAARDLQNVSIIVNVQGDEPLIEPAMIDEAIQPLVEDPMVEVATLVKHVDAAEELINPNTVKVVVDLHGYAMYFSRSPIPFQRDGREFEGFFKHIGLYVFRRDFLIKFASLPETALERSEKLEQLRILEHGYKIKAVMTQYESIPIDTQEDVDRVQVLMRNTMVSAHGT